MSTPLDEIKGFLETPDLPEFATHRAFLRQALARTKRGHEALKSVERPLRPSTSRSTSSKTLPPSRDFLLGGAINQLQEYPRRVKRVPPRSMGLTFPVQAQNLHDLS